MLSTGNDHVDVDLHAKLGEQLKWIYQFKLPSKEQGHLKCQHSHMK